MLGKNAHAWPEVWFDGLGWIQFEPTPGRGIPGAESYTNLPADQDDSAQEVAPAGSGSDITAPPPPPSTVVSPVSTLATDFQPPLQQPPRFGIPDLEDGAAAPASSGSGVPWTLAALIILVAAAVIAPWAARRLHLRSARAHDPADRVIAAWRRARGSAERAGVAGSSAMTPREWAEATAARLPVAARPMSSLATVVDRITFAPPGAVDLEHAGTLGGDLGHDCELWADQVSRVAVDTLTPAQRVREYFTDWG